MIDATAVLRAVLRGDEAIWRGAGANDAEAFLRVCVSHGVAPLVDERLRFAGTLKAWPLAISAALRASVVEHALVCGVREHALCRVLDALAASFIRPIVIKGAAVARTHY